METTLQESYCNYLKAEGFPTAHIDEDGDVLFKAEGRVYFIRIREDYPEHFTLVCPSFWTLEDAEETNLALTVCNEVNLRVHGVTLISAYQAVSAVVELFLADPEDDIHAVFHPSLKAIQAAAYGFTSMMHKAQLPYPPSGANATVPAQTNNGAANGSGYL
jgi:hypothetical protein